MLYRNLDCVNSLLENLNLTRNWRNPFGFWGKLAKMVYGRNRLKLRAKLMNIWRNNRYNIQSQVQTNFITTSLPISIKFSDLPCEVLNNFRDDAILSNIRNDTTHEIEQGEIHLTTGSISKDHFANQVSQSRHLAGERRETISEQLENKSVSNFHYSLFTKPDIFTAAKHGNFNSLHSTDVLRKVKLNLNELLLLRPWLVYF